MSQIGELHKKLMRHIECAFHNVLSAQARLENGLPSDQVEDLAETLQSAHYFLIEAQKLAKWMDTGEVE